MNNALKLLSVLSGVTVGIIPAIAAPDVALVTVQGKVLVNHGRGYVVDTKLAVGDWVWLGERAVATVVFGGTCSVPLPAEQAVRITADMGCDGMLGPAGLTGDVIAPASASSAGSTRPSSAPPATVAAVVATTVAVSAAASLPVLRRPDTGPAASAP